MPVTVFKLLNVLLHEFGNNSIYTIASAEQRAKYDTGSDTEDEDTNIHGKSQQVEGYNDDSDLLEEDNQTEVNFVEEEDLILEGMPAAEGVSVSDMYKHKGKVSQRFFLYSNPEWLMKLANDESNMVNNAKVVVNLPRNRARNRTNKNQQKLHPVMVELLTTGNLYYVIDGPPKTNSLSQ
ncbi:hypothetical protein FXO38_32682 [Capsicum annuum]|uniref:Uncharacterized protein n=1 Tax=Capsicum annuum TaxID=4072 RepID=A0A2G2YL83_CAPAN|nr:hypothetical protein FXO38_32682 [Capsicum annuum]KAF3623981.1 hypothetical protein FXO37_31599 [Capsicum annuum]PHT70503.1 hypothetical protein T459_25607 [Capsicum annuum]